jgi:hypothetical protein
MSNITARNQASAAFVVETARAEGVHVAIAGSPRGPCVFAWAPTARTPEHQLACERSFKRAVYRNLRTVRLYVAKPRGHA